jgi:hypothetical protein
LFDIFLAFDVILLVVLAVLIYKNKYWKYQPIFIICYISIVITIILTVIF